MPRRRPGPSFDWRSTCPISSLLDLVGDRWTLLVVRDLFFAQAHRFGDFLKSSEGIPTNLLADRLRRLEKIGIVRKIPYQKRPVRYEYHLTPMGEDLLPVLIEMGRWALRYLPFTVGPPSRSQREESPEVRSLALRERERARDQAGGRGPPRIRASREPVRSRSQAERERR